VNVNTQVLCSGASETDLDVLSAPDWLDKGLDM
jgi:hypothetical protein